MGNQESVPKNNKIIRKQNVPNYYKKNSIIYRF